MKILFINISDISGGSAKAAYRLGSALQQSGEHNVKFLVRSKFSTDNNVIPTRSTKLKRLAERVINIFCNLLGLQYQWLPFSPKVILKTAHEFQPDIIGLHNTIGGYFVTKDLVELSHIAPIVWTLHDMWAFTGNAAHTFGAESWKQMKTGQGEKKIFPWIGFNTGEWLLKQKKEIYKNSNITIVAPSKWLYDLAVQSPVFVHKSIHQIYHGVDLNKFRKLDKSEIRKKLNIPIDVRVLMFGAEKLGKNYWKGGKDLLDILQIINSNTKEKLYLIALGKGDLKQLNGFENFKIISPGFITSEDKMIQYYSASDLFLYPTRADNLPLSLIEPIACGLPCITYDIGGCKEIIRDNMSGYVIPPYDKNTFADIVLDTLFNEKKLSELSKNSRKLASDLFDIKFMQENYLRLFTSLITNLSN